MKGIRVRVFALILGIKLRKHIAAGALAVAGILLLSQAALGAPPKVPPTPVDGVVLISQDAALAGGISGACDTPGFPVTICQSGSYRLSSNLTVPDANTNGIVIDADKVTIDLNGFSISGPAVCADATYPVVCTATGTGVGISNVRSTTGTIRNGTVRGMGRSGIELAGFGNSYNTILVEKVHAESNAGPDGAGIQVYGGSVTQCTATTNAGDGLRLDVGNAISNMVRTNGRNGISGGGVVSDNAVSGNGQNGIHLALNVFNNMVGFNLGFALYSVQAYRGNVLLNGGGGLVGGGGTSLGQNLCGSGIVC
jgi:hypothetical protein